MIWELVGLCDEYIDKAAPWKLAKNPDDAPRLKTVLNTSARVLRLLTVSLYPFMPQTAKQLAQQLGLPFDFSKAVPPTAFEWKESIENDLTVPLTGTAIIVSTGRLISKGQGLFPRIESITQGAKPVSDIPATPQPTSSIPASTPIVPSPAPQAISPTQITIDEFQKIQLKTAKVLSAERVPKSEKLLRLQVSLGEGTEPRQIVAGIGKKYEPEVLVGKTIVIVANLKPAKLMGIESQGMVLAAGDSEVQGLITILEEVDPGTKVK